MVAARAAGFGDKKGADGAAVKAMRGFLNQVNFNGRVVIGEGERDEAPMLHIDETLGTGKGLAVDIAVDPLENTNATASLGPRAISVLAASERGGLFHAPGMYMEKLIVGPGGDFRGGGVPWRRGVGIRGVRGTGAAPEGVITAAGIRCLKGEIQGRFWPQSKEEERRLVKMGGKLGKIYTHKELASGKTIMFCATGVTSGEALQGVKFFGGGARTHSLVMSTQTEKVRFIDTTHVFDKNKIDYRL